MGITRLIYGRSAMQGLYLMAESWYDERRTPVLIVPSVVTLVERNILINQEHPDFARIQASQPAPVRWDARLWRR